MMCPGEAQAGSAPPPQTYGPEVGASEDPAAASRARLNQNLMFSSEL